MTVFITQCPHCKTSFRVSVTLLESAEGKVRCGACLNIFVADNNLLPNPTVNKTQESRADIRGEQDAGEQIEHGSNDIDPADSDDADPYSGNTSPQEQDFIFTLDMEDSLPGRINPIIGDDIDLDDTNADADGSFLEETGDETGDEAADNMAAPHSEANADSSIEQSIAIDSEQEVDGTLYQPHHFSGSGITEDAEDETDQSDTAFAMKTPFILQEDQDAKPSPNFKFSAIDDDQFYADDAEDRSSKQAFSHDNIASLKNVNSPLELDWQESSLAGRVSIFGFIAIIVLCLTLAAQLAWFNRDTLAQIPTARPFLEQSCALVGCELPKLGDLDAITSDSLIVKSHDQYSNVLSVNLIIRNDAPFAQAFPILLLKFTNPENELVAERELLPDEYLPTQLSQLGMMPPSSPVQINFDILDPGENAVNYEVSFSLPEAL